LKVFYVAPFSPWPPVHGGSIRAAKIAERLMLGHEVSLGVASDMLSVLDPVAKRTDLPIPFHVIYPDPYPLPTKLRMRLTPAGHFRRSLRPHHRNICRKQFLEAMLRIKPDLVWFRGLNACWYCGLPEDGTPCVMDMDDLEAKSYARVAQTSGLISRLLISADLPSFEKTMREVAAGCRVVLLANPADVASLGENVNARALPNGFDFPAQITIRPRTGERLLFLGTLEYIPNLDGARWFCRKVWPKVRARLPSAELSIVGSYPPHARALAAIPGVILHGFVADLRPVMETATLMVVPLRRGSGTRIKVLQAWSMGVPVVSTSMGCEGLGAADGENALIADRPDDLAEKCVQLIENPDLGAMLARRAFDFGSETFDWSKVLPIVDDVVREAVAQT